MKVIPILQETDIPGWQSSIKNFLVLCYLETLPKISNFDIPVLGPSVHEDSIGLPVPDIEFITSHGFEELRHKIESQSIENVWDKLEGKAVFFGGMHGFHDYAEDCILRLFKDQSWREKADLMRLNEGQIMELYQRWLLWNTYKDDPAFEIGISNYGKCKIEKIVKEKKYPIRKKDLAYQLRFKYQIDIDGYANSWSGLFWKLYSNSLVFKIGSPYFQWYYPLLRDRFHVFATDINSLAKDVEYAKANDSEMKEIVQNGRELIARVNIDYARAYTKELLNKLANGI